MSEENNVNQAPPGDFPQMPPLTKVPKPVLVNGQLISHRKDMSDVDKIQEIIDQETKPEEPVRKSSTKRSAPKREDVDVQDIPPLTTEAPEAPTLRVTKNKLGGKDAFAAFKQAMSSATIPVKLYSEDREITLRELTVTDQKSLSKTAMLNNSRRDIVFNSQCAMINSCVKTKGFNIQEYTEFDRIVLLLRLYEQNYFKNDVKYICPKCQKENVYAIDFSRILTKIRSAWRPDKQVLVAHGDKQFKFTLGWPKVSTISEFYKNYYRQYQNANENTQNTIDQLSNVEYLVMFIKGIELILKDNEISLDLNDCSYAERSDIIDSLPQGVIFDDEDGIIAKVVSEFTDPLNKSFQYEKCQFCGAETEEGIGSIADFI